MIPIVKPLYSKGAIVRVLTENYIKDKIPKGSPGEIIHVDSHRGAFTYNVEVVTEEDGYPRVQRTFREDELESIPSEPSTGINVERKEDWRKQVQGVSVSKDALLAGTDQILRRGTGVDLVSVVRIGPKHNNVTVVVPNGTAILLNASRIAWQQAERIRAENKIDETGRFSSEKDSIDYQENVAIAVITAFTGVEAFINEMIPEDFCFEDKRGGIVIKRNKTQIEEGMSVSRKLAEILPKMFNTSSPKGTEPLWSRFKKLKNVRNRIIHMSSTDRRSSKPNEPNLWHEIFSIECPHQTALRIMDFFFNKTCTQPSWRENGPFKDDKTVHTRAD